MVRSIQILPVVLLLTLASVVRAQTAPTCGVVDVDGPSEVEANTQVVFKAKISGPIHTTKPEFQWVASVGTITAGQGTNEITLDTSGLGGQTVTLTVGLSGAPPGCKDSASKTININVQALSCNRPFDEYGNISFEDEQARLDNFAIQMSNQSLSGGQILMYAGQETYENETAERLARAKSYMADVREIDPNRIVITDCGFTRELRIQLYIIPPGVAPLSCDSSIEIPFSEVKFTKPRPKSSKRRG
ncbi:MAG TPA: hypothetical protein VF075_15540 [Pyrinomonadaceae bacterium]